MGSLPTVYGELLANGATWLLRQDGTGTFYTLPNPPDGLQVGALAAVSGLPQTVNEQDQLLWQEMTVYSPPSAAPQPTAVPLQSVTITAVQLVYLRQPTTVTGLDVDSFVPAWAFSGTADNGAQAVAWVTAVSSE